MAAIEKQYAKTDPSTPRRIHIIGLGSIGKLVAHSLRGIPDPPPVTLIFHRAGWLSAWEKSEKTITVRSDDQDSAHDGFDCELRPEMTRRHGVAIHQGQPDVYDIEGMKPAEAAEAIGDTQPPEPPLDYHGYSDEPIHNLIVTCKAYRTVPALLSLKPRIAKDATIAFLQNGMGIIDEVNEKVFPDESTRPNYVQGIISHGANVPPEMAEKNPFAVVHAGHGTIALGLLPRTSTKKVDLTPDETSTSSPNDETWDPSARYLLRTLVRTPVLAAISYTASELIQQQLEKLAVNSVLNPITALIDARNGFLTHNFAYTRTMRLMLAETSLVIRSLPELKAIPNINQRFSADRLETLCVNVAKRTAQNVSSTLADVRSGRQTELQYINGYIVDRGDEQGIKCVVNYSIMQLVIGKSTMTQREAQEEVPIEKVWMGKKRGEGK